MRGATEKYHYPELVGEPLRLGLNFTFSLKHVTQFIVLGDQMSLVTVDKFGVDEKKIQNGGCFFSANNKVSTTQVSVP